jgi:hypothetical protein
MNTRLNTANTREQSVLIKSCISIQRHTDVESIADILDPGRGELSTYEPSQLTRR